MQTIHLFATLFLGLTIILCGGMMLRYVVVYARQTSRVEEIRRLRQEGLAVNQDSAA
jgi:hypothetical protein